MSATPLRRVVIGLAITACLLGTVRGAAQEAQSYRHVSWPLLDIVTLPDPCAGFRLIVAPSPRTTAWKKGTQVVQFGLDPVEALQWASLAHAFARSEAVAEPKSRAPARYLPALRPARGRRLLLLADYGTRARPDQRYALVVSDSAERAHYKVFVSAAQVDELADAVEGSAELARRTPIAPDSASALTEGDPGIDTPVRPGHFPKLEYPPGLLLERRIGRVWMQYVVSADGRAEEGSFQAFLSDDPRFTESVLRMLRDATFQPATSHGVPVRQRVFQVFTFLTS